MCFGFVAMLGAATILAASLVIVLRLSLLSVGDLEYIIWVMTDAAANGNHNGLADQLLIIHSAPGPGCGGHSDLLAAWGGGIDMRYSETRCSPHSCRVCGDRNCYGVLRLLLPSTGGSGGFDAVFFWHVYPYCRVYSRCGGRFTLGWRAAIWVAAPRGGLLLVCNLNAQPQRIAGDGFADRTT